MKLIFLIFYFFFISIIAFSQVFITSDVKNVPAGTPVEIKYYNNVMDEVRVSALKSKTGENGMVVLNFDFFKPKSAYLTIGSQSTELFLVPGDSLHISVDYNHFDESIHFTGRGAADNNYLAAELQQNFQLKGYLKFNIDIDQFKKYIDSLEKASNEFLRMNDSPEFTPEFRKYISAETKYRFIGMRWKYKYDPNPAADPRAVRQLPENYFSFLKTIDLNDQAAAESPAYRYALEIFQVEIGLASGKGIPDSLPVIQHQEMYITQNYNYIKSIFKEKVLDCQLTVFLRRYIVTVISDANYTDSLIKDYKYVCNNAEYKSIIDTFLNNQLIKFASGKPAPAFRLLSLTGEQVSLASLKGKTVYMDFWFTGCAPCKAAFPQMQKLIKKFEGRNDVVFLTIDLRDNFNVWKEFLLKAELKGVHLLADKDQAERLFRTYNFNGTPHYVIIDSKGMFFNANAVGPATAEKSILEAMKINN